MTRRSVYYCQHLCLDSPGARGKTLTGTAKSVAIFASSTALSGFLLSKIETVENLYLLLANHAVVIGPYGNPPYMSRVVSSAVGSQPRLPDSANY